MRHIATLGISAVLISGLGGIGWGEGPGPAPEELFKKLDANGDSKIEAKEAEGDQARKRFRSAVAAPGAAISTRAASSACSTRIMMAN